MPSRNEADPSVLLALAVPLMFGYMFGDVGQGLVIAAVGFALRRRFPIARLFIAGGLVRGRVRLAVRQRVQPARVLPALWMEPLDDPLAILLVPLVGGAVLLTVGLLLDALEAYWRGELGTSGSRPTSGYSSRTSACSPDSSSRAGFVVAGAGALVFCLGHAVHAGRPAAALTAVAELVERLLQILINTLSFARVGAFALAHAGLSSAIVALMQASDNVVAKALVLVARQRHRDRARGDGGLDPDHAAGAVRVLHPVPRRPRGGSSARCRRPLPSRRRA